MRYTIIHHDVREHFNLTPIQYMVVDSIHQLSHGAPTKKPNTKIADFLGIDEGSVRNAVKIGIEKGILFQSDDGLTSTEKWNHAVIYMPIRKDSEEIRKDSESHNIYIKNNNSDAEASRKEKNVNIPPVSGGRRTEYEPVPVDDDGNEISRQKPSAPTKDAQKVYVVFKSTIGISNPMWTKNKTERIAAQTLFDDKGLEKVQKVLEFWLENKDDPFCPDVTSPYKLASKWEAMIMYRKKNGL